jgi:(p)ppGpp synthase/HD superfamily hydrolase
MSDPSPLISTDLERALRRAAEWHVGQARKGSRTPYVEHLAGVALVLARLGLDDEVVIAGLLHDAVEDTPEFRAEGPITLDTIAAEFGPRVAELVASCSERKTDSAGAKRPWADRKRDHLEHLAGSDRDTRALALADKLHNLVSIRVDLEDGLDVWSKFNADRPAVLAYHRAAIERLGHDLRPLADACRDELAAIEARPVPSGTASTNSLH